MQKIVLTAMAALGVAAGASLVTASPASAGGHQVCMEGPYDYIECAYDTFAACYATASGLGADCRLNPNYTGYRGRSYGEPLYYSDEPPPRRRRYRREDY
jgi:hypothetical protein